MILPPGVPASEEDEEAAELYVNSDDDDGNNTDDRDDTDVSGENDLYGISLTVSPGSVSGGSIAIRHYNAGTDPSGDTDLWKDDHKATALQSSYQVSAGLPEEIWVEGLHVSDVEGDERVQITYTWGGVSLSDEIRLTVLPRDGTSDGTSEASLAIHADAARETEVSGVIGGMAYSTLYVTVGAGERMSSTAVELIIRDEYDGYFAGTKVELTAGNALAPKDGWEKWNPVTEEWDSDSGPVGSDNKDGSNPIKYRALLDEWNTMTQPLGNNGGHAVFVGEQENDEWKPTHVEFEEFVVGQGWVNPYENGPLGRGVQTENVFLADADSSNGTIDYFKFDPDGDTALQTPHITFDIEDADPHNYCVIIRFRQTVGEGTWDWDTGGWSSMRVDLGANMSANIDLTEADYQGNCLNANDNEWGTYTYDLLVLEYAGAGPVWTQGEAMDWNFLKRYRDGYHLWVPKDLPSPWGDELGHRAWNSISKDKRVQLKGYYCLDSNWPTDTEAQIGRSDRDVEIIVVDPWLTEQSTTTGPGFVGVVGAQYGTEDVNENGRLDGLTLYPYGDGYMGGAWRGIFTGIDMAGLRSPAWRTHDPVRMLVANQTDGSDLTADNMVFSWGYYEGKPCSTVDTEFHPGDTYAQSPLKFPSYSSVDGEEHYNGAVTRSYLSVGYRNAQDHAGFGRGYLTGNEVDRSWEDACNSLKTAPYLFSFHGHGAVEGQATLSFWDDEKWQILWGKNPPAAPTGAVHRSFQDSWPRQLPDFIPWHTPLPPLAERLANMRFALLLGCNTADTGTSSMANVLLLHGAQAVGGFDCGVYVAPMSMFEAYFWNFTMGYDDDYTRDDLWGGEPAPKTIQTAVDMALARVRAALQSSPYYDEGHVPDDENWHSYGPAYSGLIVPEED